jgi:hypothetical protein
VRAGVTVALIEVHIASVPNVPSRTGANKAVDLISAGTAVVTRLGSALVNILFAVVPIPASVAVARIAADVHARADVGGVGAPHGVEGAVHAWAGRALVMVQARRPAICGVISEDAGALVRTRAGACTGGFLAALRGAVHAWVTFARTKLTFESGPAVARKSHQFIHTVAIVALRRCSSASVERDAVSPGTRVGRAIPRTATEIARNIGVARLERRWCAQFRARLSAEHSRSCDSERVVHKTGGAAARVDGAISCAANRACRGPQIWVRRESRGPLVNHGERPRSHIIARAEMIVLMVRASANLRSRYPIARAVNIEAATEKVVDGSADKEDHAGRAARRSSLLVPSFDDAVARVHVDPTEERPSSQARTGTRRCSSGVRYGARSFFTPEVDNGLHHSGIRTLVGQDIHVILGSRAPAVHIKLVPGTLASILGRTANAPHNTALVYGGGRGLHQMVMVCEGMCHLSPVSPSELEHVLGLQILSKRPLAG